MIFLTGTFHILLFYIIIGLLLIISANRNWWDRLISSFWEKIDVGTKFEILSILLPILSVLSLLISYFHKTWDLLDFHLFALTSFVVLPLSTAYSGLLPLFKRKERIPLGRFLVLLFGFGGFGLAASNFHDVVWCAGATGFFTKFSKGGSDIGVWKTLFQVPRADYRILGFYMFIQVIVFLVMAHLAFSSLEKGSKRNNLTLKLNWLGMALLTLAIVLIDWPELITPPTLHTWIIGVFLAGSTLVFYKSGENLVDKNK